MALCIPFTGRLSDRIGRLPVAFSVPNLASALPALFPTEHRYSAMGIAYNVAVANQDNDPLLDLATLPFEESFVAARASHNRPGKPTVM